MVEDLAVKTTQNWAKELEAMGAYYQKLQERACPHRQGFTTVTELLCTQEESLQVTPGKPWQRLLLLPARIEI